jgi:hypothetical protein
VASGIYSFAAGNSNTASGNYSVAMGQSNIASGLNSIAIGNGNTASGQASVAIGGLTNTSGGIWSGIIGGATNTTSATYTGILAGVSNTIAANNAAIVGGGSNAINAGATYSAIIGGNNNTIGFLSGTNSTILGGSNNNTGATSYANIIGGAYGAANSLNSGVTVFPAIGLSSGVRQFITTTLYVDTTTATPTALTYDGTNTGISLPSNSAVYFRGTVIAGVTSAGNTKGWSIEGVLKATAAGTFVGTPTVTSTYADAGASAWTIALSTIGVPGGMAITVTGAAGVTIRWVANVQMTMMGF